MENSEEKNVVVNNENEEKKEKEGFAEKHPTFVEGAKKVGKVIVKAVPYILTATLSFGAGLLVGIVGNKDDSETSLVDDTDDIGDNTDVDSIDGTDVIW